MRTQSNQSTVRLTQWQETSLAIRICRNWLNFASRAIARGQSPATLTATMEQPNYLDGTLEEMGLLSEVLTQAARVRVKADAKKRAVEKLNAGQFPEVKAFFVASKA